MNVYISLQEKVSFTKVEGAFIFYKESLRKIMGTMKYLLAIIVVFVHSPLSRYIYSTEFTKFGIYIVHVMILFILFETGYIAGRQLYAGIYNTYKSFCLSRFIRLIIPCWMVLIVSFAFMDNSIYHIQKGDGSNLFDILDNLGTFDKTIYYLLHITLGISLFFFITYDPTTQSLNYFDIATRSGNHLVDNAISLSVAPTLWTIFPDIVLMLGLSYFYFKKQYNFLIGVLVFFIIAHVFMVTNVVWSDWDGLMAFDSIFVSMAFLMFGFMFGRKEKLITFNSKILSGIVAVTLLISATVFCAWATYHLNYYLIMLSFILIIPAYGLVSDALWNIFSYKKFDMLLRDLSTHIYLWHFFALSMLFYYFDANKLSFWELMGFYIGYIAFVSSFAYHVERKGRHFTSWFVWKTCGIPMKNKKAKPPEVVEGSKEVEVVENKKT